MPFPSGLSGGLIVVVVVDVADDGLSEESKVIDRCSGGDPFGDLVAGTRFGDVVLVRLTVPASSTLDCE